MTQEQEQIIRQEINKIIKTGNTEPENSIIGNTMNNINSLGNQAVDVVEDVVTGVIGFARGIVNLITFRKPER